MYRTAAPAAGRLLGRGHLIALDTLAALGYTAVLALGLRGGPSGPAGAALPVWAQFAAVAAVGPPVALRRLWPLPVFGLVLAASLLAAVTGVVRDPLLAAAFALYTVAVTACGHPRVPTPAIGVLSVAGLLAGGAVDAEDWWTGEFGTVAAGGLALGLAWTVGRAVRERRAYAARSAAQLAERAVLEERLRIARDLHDIVTHSMGLVAVKAAVANHVLAARPDEAQDALRVIETTSRGALVELRHMLGALRSGTDGGRAPADLSPAPGPVDLPALAERASSAGIHVDMRLCGVDGLPDTVGLSVYRIVQEALTNVVKHAPAARCTVLVAAEESGVRVEVVDDGPGSGGQPERRAAPGHGLIGMRERVALYGGSLRAGDVPGGGFAVVVRLPYEVPHEPAGPAVVGV